MFADPAIWFSVLYVQISLPENLSIALISPLFVPTIILLPNIKGGDSRALPSSYFHFILPSDVTAINVPLSFPKYIVPSLTTGDDFVLAPVETLHNNAGEEGSSVFTNPARSELPRNTFHPGSVLCEDATL
jgi:hypothetical protein